MGNLAVCQYVQALTETARAFSQLKTKFPQLEGIVTSSEINAVVLNNSGLSLGECICKVGDQSLRTLLFHWHSHYPVDSFFDETICENDLVNQDYTVMVAGLRHNATNLAIVYNNGAFLFTLGLHSDLQKNELLISSGDGSVLPVCNLYACSDENLAFVSRFIIERGNWNLSIAEQIDALFEGRVKRTKGYVKSFNNIASDCQRAILERLQRAKEMGLLDFKVDNDIFKQTVGFEKKRERYGPMYELRIREPMEIRIYFQYVDSLYYVLLMGGKGSDQNADIGQAYERISQLR